MEQQQSGFSAPIVVASRYGTLWALDTRDGSICWRLTPTGRHPTLVHDGDTLYISSHIPLAAFRELDAYNGAPIPPGRSSPRIHASPAELVALRLSDATAIWQRDGWTCTSNSLALDGDILLSEGPVQDIGDVRIHALDPHNGAIRWTRDAGPPYGLRGRLLGARANQYLRMARR